MRGDSSLVNLEEGVPQFFIDIMMAIYKKGDMTVIKAAALKKCYLLV